MNTPPDSRCLEEANLNTSGHIFYSFKLFVLIFSQGQVLTGNDVSGALCIGQPWPGMARSIYGDHQRFVDAYFKPYPGKNMTVSHDEGGVAYVEWGGL